MYAGMNSVFWDGQEEMQPVEQSKQRRKRQARQAPGQGLMEGLTLEIYDTLCHLIDLCLSFLSDSLFSKDG